MFCKMNQKRNKQWRLALICSILSLCFTGVIAGEKGGDSPDTVFKTAQEAGAKKDFNVLTKLVAPSEYAMLAFGTDMGVGMFIEFYEGEKAPELQKKYQEIQKRYGIKTGNEDEGEKLQINQDTPQEVIDAHMLKRAKKLYGHVDVAQYVPEIMALVIHMPEMAEQSFFPQEALTDLKIDEDKATGTAGDKALSFIREDGRWYLTADVMN